jgi:hypothetical protein
VCVCVCVCVFVCVCVCVLCCVCLVCVCLFVVFFFNLERHVCNCSVVYTLHLFVLFLVSTSELRV